MTYDLKNDNKKPKIHKHIWQFVEKKGDSAEFICFCGCTIVIPLKKLELKHSYFSKHCYEIFKKDNSFIIYKGKELIKEYSKELYIIKETKYGYHVTEDITKI